MTILSHPNELSHVREGGHDLCGDKHSSMGLTKKALWPMAGGRWPPFLRDLHFRPFSSTWLPR